MIAEPDYNFEVGQSTWEDQIGKIYFTENISILKCTSGRAVISINSQQHILQSNVSFILLDSMLFQVLDRSEDFMMTYCLFSLRFFNEIYPMLDDKVIDGIQFNAPDLYQESDLELADLAFRHLCALYKNKDHAYKNRLAINLVINYILEIYEILRPLLKDQQKSTTNYSSYIFGRFYRLVYEHHLEHKNIEFYTKQLNISSRYLYKITKNVLQITPKQLIDYYIVSIAKKLLLTTILTNQQIGDKLNFSDQSSFGQFFKRNVGISPSEFRRKYK